ncbi:nuclear transport factor 2 family protein [Catalinimonas niigatensis]|uniref:nuclear transport factor 2 family protein n=1 Tax=Catalinimonas niigatensis TaxID=1397264 RepID=UPI0026669633|nr:nuclear transport factor 2 family protein [Catalinimonas niigatensis]WPP49090.1 nuclear transport factor 2 family protein [Catalinimonas niigatensis]
MKHISLFVALIIILLTACGPSEEEKFEQQIRSKAIDYFATYQQRKDWNKFLSFYHPNIAFTDVALSTRTRGIDAFEKFYNWPDSNFQKMNPAQKHLELQDIITQDSLVVARGHFNPFYWHGEKQEWSGGFTIWLYFDKNLKIRHQVDYIQYPASVILSARR